MARFVLMVDLEIDPHFIDDFIVAVREQVEKTISLELGCHRFDVVRRIDEDHKFVHYEIFEDEQAFRDHATMSHTILFSERIKPMIVKVEVRQGRMEISSDG